MIQIDEIASGYGMIVQQISYNQWEKLAVISRDETRSKHRWQGLAVKWVDMAVRAFFIALVSFGFFLNYLVTSLVRDRSALALILPQAAMLM